jgi:hypothetical protein
MMKRAVGIVVICSLSLLAGSAWAGELFIWTLDPSRSTLLISGEIEGAALREQGPGSLTTSYSDTISTEILGTFNSATLPSGISFVSSAAVANVSGNWYPGPWGTDATEAAGYGARAYISGITGYFALRDMNFNLSSVDIGVNSSGGFNSGSITSTAHSGVVDYRTSGLYSDSGRENLQGRQSTNATSGGSIYLDGTTATLTIPIDITFALGGDVSGYVRFQGEFVATTTVPVAPGSGPGPGQRLLYGAYNYGNPPLTYPEGGVDGGYNYYSYQNGGLGDGDTSTIAATWREYGGFRTVTFYEWPQRWVIDSIRAYYSAPNSNYQMVCTNMGIRTFQGWEWRGEITYNREQGPFAKVDSWENPSEHAAQEVNVSFSTETDPQDAWTAGITEVAIWGHPAFPPIVDVGGLLAYDADHTSISPNIGATSDPDGHALISFEWEIDGQVVATGSTPSIPITAAGLAHPNSTNLLDLVVTDSSLEMSRRSVQIRYNDAAPVVGYASGVNAPDGFVQFSAVVDDADLSLNSLISGFEDVVWEFDTDSIFGEGFLIGDGAVDGQTLRSILGGSGVYTIYANAQDLTGYTDSYPFLIAVPAGPQHVSGDTDRDGDVDLVDLGNLAAGYGLTSGATWEQGDFDGDGDVDLVDLGGLATNYGHGVPAPLDFAADAAKIGLSSSTEAETADNQDPAPDKISLLPSGVCSSIGAVLMVSMMLAFCLLDRRADMQR